MEFHVNNFWNSIENFQSNFIIIIDLEFYLQFQYFKLNKNTKSKILLKFLISNSVKKYKVEYYLKI